MLGFLLESALATQVSAFILTQIQKLFSMPPEIGIPVSLGHHEPSDTKSNFGYNVLNHIIPPISICAVLQEMNSFLVPIENYLIPHNIKFLEE
jgi:hypothetical protein